LSGPVMHRTALRRYQRQISTFVILFRKKHGLGVRGRSHLPVIGQMYMGDQHMLWAVAGIGKKHI
jgi:hypothetical protein